MTIYPEQKKDSLIKRMLPPSNADVPKLSRETGIPQDTLYGWRQQGNASRVPRGKAVCPQGQTQARSRPGSVVQLSQPLAW